MYYQHYYKLDTLANLSQPYMGVSNYAMHKWKAPPDFIRLVLCPWTVVATHLGDAHEWLCQLEPHALLNANEQLCHVRQT
jgi:hypothetical protein